MFKSGFAKRCSLLSVAADHLLRMGSDGAVNSPRSTKWQQLLLLKSHTAIAQSPTAVTYVIQGWAAGFTWNDFSTSLYVFVSIPVPYCPLLPHWKNGHFKTSLPTLQCPSQEQCWLGLAGTWALLNSAVERHGEWDSSALPGNSHAAAHCLMALPSAAGRQAKGSAQILPLLKDND